MCSNLALFGADVSRLPFSCGSVDTDHADAALHCWPSPSNAVDAVSSPVSIKYDAWILHGN